jgi:integrase
MSELFTASTPSSSAIKIPMYRRHKASGQAVVTLAGRDVYLGSHGSPASKAEYRRRIAEYLASNGAPPAGACEGRTVAELLLRYWKHVQAYYKAETRDGTIKPTLRRLRRLYGPTSVREFGPLRLKAFRQTLIEERDDGGRRLSRPYINRSVRLVRSVFKWGVGEELVPAAVYHGLLAVDGLRLGRSDAPEPPGVGVVADSIVEATLVHLCPTVADMVRVQRLTGMRPGEVCRMTTAELDTTGKVWLYTPIRHMAETYSDERSAYAFAKTGRYFSEQELRNSPLGDPLAHKFSDSQREFEDLSDAAKDRWRNRIRRKPSLRDLVEERE